MKTMSCKLSRQIGRTFASWTLCTTFCASVVFAPRLATAHGEVHEQIRALTQELQSRSDLRRSGGGPQRALLLHKRAELYRADGDLRAALRDYAAAQRADPSLEVIKLSRGRVLLEGGDAQLAIPELASFVAGHPEHVEARTLLARARQRLGDVAGADEAYADAMRLADDPVPDLFLERAANLIGGARPDDALAVLQHGIVALGHLYVLHDMAMLIETERGKYAAALIHLDALIESQPQNLALLARRVELLLRDCRHAEAERTRLVALERLGMLTQTQQERSNMIRVRESLAQGIQTAGVCK